MRNELFERILDKYSEHLKNININHKKLIICLSGIPASGKTHIAKVLEEKYNAVRVENDEIRRVIKKIMPDTDRDERQEILQEFLIWLISNYKYKNGLIILDSSIDRKYDAVREIASENGFGIFVIKVNVSREVAEKRARGRNNGKEDMHFTKEIGRWIRENEDFARKGKIDIIVENNDEMDLNNIFKMLDKFIYR